ncbi:MAG: hypothetical protein JWO08_382, partial [Verrucomicrobiaceae bacterium]|nr:hypothetical protein [Verrucomicrobiaceae bacterium]
MRPARKLGGQGLRRFIGQFEIG